MSRVRNAVIAAAAVTFLAGAMGAQAALAADAGTSGTQAAGECQPGTLKATLTRPVSPRRA
ncbi:hypothetical protein NKH77_25980 [Streptomyces sp. M19]